MSETKTWVTIYSDDSRAEVLYRYWMKFGDEDAGFEDCEVTDPDSWTVINEVAREQKEGKLLVFSIVTRR